ncbi:phosphatidylinositol glycan, class H [Trypanosoma theileri]|uniref:Phosphatidylinositol glycan, class H n=1 Tax=Trypanosoma theileri TaxID=67003 RepID=A0A1X0NP87_9TRYP|nr:phosphatidylinositol glycan, class H [Trypanosoma theileri]ORC86421.1 phosphatidylinositol glycan, class H [Trypanosoma theileri]
MSNTNNGTSLPQETPPILLASNHKTNSNAVVDVFQVNYSDSVRLYRVSRRDALGPQTPPILRLFSPNDLMLLIVFVALELPSLPTFVDYLRSIGVGNGWTFFPYGESGSNAISSFTMALMPYNGKVSWHLPRIIPIVICCLVLLYRLITGLRRAHTEEVTVIRGLGIQLTVYNIFGRIISQRFVEHKLIRALIIHDAYFRCQAIFFLSAIVENEGDLLVLFEETLPRLAVLQPLLRGLRHILYEEPEDGATLAELADRMDDSADGDDSDIVTDREERLSLASTTPSASSIMGNATSTTISSGIISISNKKKKVW